MFARRRSPPGLGVIAERLTSPTQFAPHRRPAGRQEVFPVQEPVWIDNYQTETKSRVDSDKAISLKRYNEVFETFVRPNLRYDETYTWDANINGIIVRYVGNSLHQYQF